MPFQTFEFPINKDHAHRYNELVSDRRRLQASALILTIILSSGAYIAYLRHAHIGIVVALCVLALAAGLLIVVIPTVIGSVEKTFRTSGLAPGMIAEVRDNGMTLLSLVDIARQPSEEPIWALAARDVRDIPGIRRAVGTRVPCVAVTGSQQLFRRLPYWDLATPMPIAWGTDDRQVVKSASQRIPSEEWHRLEGKLDQVEDVRRSPHSVLRLPS